MCSKIVIFIVLLIAVILVLAFVMVSKPALDIDSFEDCVNAGYPVMESYPRQCRTPDGKTFTEQICIDMCGDGECQEIVCLGTSCPCAETPESCPEDCA